MFGQLIYPRIVARIFPEGRAVVSIRPISVWSKFSSWLGLWQHTNFKDQLDFLELYGSTLEFIARSREADGHPRWASNPVTKLFEEVILASDGTRNNLALTLATSVEGLTKMIMPGRVIRPDAPQEEIQDLVRHIKLWNGPDNIKDAAIRAVDRHTEMTVDRIHKLLISNGSIKKSDVTAWKSIRHKVAHGELMSPYSSEGEDNKIVALGSLMRDLAHCVFRQPGDGTDRCGSTSYK